MRALLVVRIFRIFHRLAVSILFSLYSSGKTAEVKVCTRQWLGKYSKNNSHRWA